MALSAANQFLSIGQLRADMPKTLKEVWPSGYGPYVLGGILGVPFWDLGPESPAGGQTDVGIWGDSRRIFCVFATETRGLEDERLGQRGRSEERRVGKEGRS